MSNQIPKFTFIIFLSIFILGTLGYIFIEGWSPLESLYMTVITLTTVGFGEVYKLTPSGRVFTIILIVVGVGVVAYTVRSLAQEVVEVQVRKVLGRRKLENKIKSLKNHYIICGYGRIGSLICKELAAKPLPFVVVENDPEILPRIEEENFLYVAGDATEEEVLIQAGINKAKGLVAALSSDADNVYIVLTARGLNPHLFILARACEEASEKKLKQAGADKVICPYHIGGLRMAHAILRPAVVDFIEIATRSQSMELQIEEIPVEAPSKLVDTTLKESGIREELGVIIVAIKKASGAMAFNPSPQTKIQAGDVFIALGEKRGLIQLEKMLS